MVKFNTLLCGLADSPADASKTSATQAESAAANVSRDLSPALEKQFWIWEQELKPKSLLSLFSFKRERPDLNDYLELAELKFFESTGLKVRYREPADLSEFFAKLDELKAKKSANPDNTENQNSNNKKDQACL